MTIRALALSAATLALAGSSIGAQGHHRAAGRLSSFRTEAEVARYLGRIVAAEKARDAEEIAPPPCTAARSVARVVTPPRGTGATSRAPTVIRGDVKNVRGEPLAGATISIGALAPDATTDAMGRYRLSIPTDSLAKPRTVTLLARRVGSEARRHELIIRHGETVQVDFALCGTVTTLRATIATAIPVAKDAPAAAAAAPAAGNAESVTNTQHQGVDEGGIVKLHGDYLVMLRRGRLFTVDIGDRTLRPIAAVDAFGPDIDPRSSWYDELIVSGDKVVVVGYSYERGGTEIGVFHIDGAGGLQYKGTYHLRSNDYYSSRNYASRLVHGKLVFYTPLTLSYDVTNVLDALPAMRRWRGDTSASGFRRIALPRHVYRPAHELDPSSETTLHTVTTCDLATEELQCSASVVIGPEGRVFYVSPTSVYVWVGEGAGHSGATEDASTLYRMPLDGSAPSALAASGSPVDQFSFLEGEDGMLNVVVRSESGGDAMWHARRAHGTIALLRVPLASFGNGSDAVPADRYTPLPEPGVGDFQNRFVGDRLLYGAGNGWGNPKVARSLLYVVGLERSGVRRLELPHGTDRIEAMGSEAVVIGASGGDLRFSGISLGERPSVVQQFTMAGASQGELRSHGFFYKPDGPESGVIGLPISGAARPGYRHLIEGSASVLFLRNAGHEFSPLGQLAAGAASEMDDGCRVSCVDWYGNARPLFARGRVFALLGYELVEGAIADGAIREIGRVSYAPRVIQARGR